MQNRTPPPAQRGGSPTTLVLVALFRLEQAISDARRTIVGEGGNGVQGPRELIEIDHRQERLDWMRAEFRAAQQRRYDKAAITLAAATALTTPAPAPKT